MKKLKPEVVRMVRGIDGLSYTVIDEYFTSIEYVGSKQEDAHRRIWNDGMWLRGRCLVDDFIGNFGAVDYDVESNLAATIAVKKELDAAAARPPVAVKAKPDNDLQDFVDFVIKRSR